MAPVDGRDTKNTKQEPMKQGNTEDDNDPHVEGTKLGHYVFGK